MPHLQQMAAELTGHIPGLPFVFARKFINRAIEEIRGDYLWSWNIAQGVMITPAVISAGLVSVTQFSASVTFDATAGTPLLAAATAVPPLILRQFRVGSGPIYSITAYNTGTRVATLDRIYTETTNATAAYSVYKAYYQPTGGTGVPVTNFLRFLSILDTSSGYSISGRRLYMTQEELRMRDPLRGSLGQPYYLANYLPDSVGNAQWELWPHPQTQTGLLIQYQKRHVDLTEFEELPLSMSIVLVQYRAFEFAYRWALENSGRIPELKNVDWRFLMKEVGNKYATGLVGAKREDKEILVRILKLGSQAGGDFGPIDSNFAQSHGVPAY